MTLFYPVRMTEKQWPDETDVTQSSGAIDDGAEKRRRTEVVWDESGAASLAAPRVSGRRISTFGLT